jgi:hypothetical protein
MNSVPNALDNQLGNQVKSYALRHLCGPIVALAPTDLGGVAVDAVLPLQS